VCCPRVRQRHQAISIIVTANVPLQYWTRCEKSTPPRHDKSITYLIATPGDCSSWVKLLVDTFTALEAQITASDVEINQRSKSDPTARRLMTIPGVGPIASTAITALVPAAEGFPAGARFRGLARTDAAGSDLGPHQVRLQRRPVFWPCNSAREFGLAVPKSVQKLIICKPYCAPEVGSFEMRSPEPGSFEMRFREHGSFETRSLEPGSVLSGMWLECSRCQAPAPWSTSPPGPRQFFAFISAV
jgi:hypothetical protein